jgi:hypothetical protein
MQTAKLTVEMSHGTSNVEPYRSTRITISDAVNHHTIAEVRLTPEQVYSLITGHITDQEITGEVITPVLLAHLNQETHTFSRLFKHDHEYTGRVIDFGRDVDPNRIPEYVAWARGIGLSTWSHKWTWRRKSRGLELVMWRYETGLSDEEKTKIRDALATATPPKGLK